MGRTFYLRPHLRRDATAISSALAATIALISLEGFATGKYHQTSRGQEGERTKKEGALIFRHIHEQIMGPRVLGVGICEHCTGLCYLTYVHAIHQSIQLSWVP